MNIEELSQQDSREVEEMDFSAFSLQDESPSEAIEDLRLGWGRHYDSGDAFSSFDDGEFDGGADYVPSWA